MTDRIDPKSKGFKEIKWIPVKNLSVIWVQSQRALNEKHAQAIADSFDPEMFGTLAVTKPNGHGIYHLIDGQHRKVALEKLWGLNELAPCQVFDAEDPARAAQLFDHINSARRRPQPVEIFKVRVTAKNEVEVEVNRIVMKCNYYVGSSSSVNSTSISCVHALIAVYQSYGPPVLEATLRLIRKIWGEDKSATNSHIVKGIGMFLSEFRHADLDKLSAAMAKKFTPSRFTGAARNAKDTLGINIATAARNVIVQTYNNAVRGEKNKLYPKKANDE